jgi:hypothetical protein
MGVAVSVDCLVTVVANKQVVVVQTGWLCPGTSHFDEFNNDIDSVVFEFPISVKFEQYNTLQAANETVLNSNNNGLPKYNCGDTYTCIDFVYPISFQSITSRVNKRA